MRGLGWIDDETAAKLAFKFAGEPLGDEEVRNILKNTEPLPSSDAGAATSQGKQEEEEEDS